MALRHPVIRVLILAMLAMSLYFAATEPCTSAEGVVYERFASHTVEQILKQPLDPRLGIVYGLLARLATRLGGVSELTIRIPALLGGVLFWWALAEICGRWRSWAGVAVFLAIAANPWTFRLFSSANGAALAVGLFTAAAARFQRSPSSASLLVGLAMGSDAFVAIPALALGAVAALILRIGFWKWMDEVLLPGLVVGLLLLLPVLLIRERPLPAAANDTGTRAALRALMKQPRGAGKVRLGVSPTLEPGAFFYRRRYHLDWLQLVPPTANADFFLLPAGPPVRMRALETAQGAVLAKP